VAGREDETCAAVLQVNAGAGDDDAGAEAHVVGLDERHHIAGGIGGGEQDRSTGFGRAVSRIAGAGGIDQGGALADVVSIEQMLDGCGHVSRVGDVAMGIDEGELHRFRWKDGSPRRCRGQTGGCRDAGESPAPVARQAPGR